MKKVLVFFMVLFCTFVGSSWAGGINAEYEVSGDYRGRYQYQYDLDFNSDAKDNGGLIYSRVRVGLKTVLKNPDDEKLLTIFLQGLDARSGGHNLKAKKNQRDSLDLSEGYLYLHEFLSPDMGLKVGRQTMKYGKCRLLATPAWNNKVRCFDGGVFKYKTEDFLADLIYVRAVNFDDNNLNESSADEELFGFYGTWKMSEGKTGLDGYFLTLEDQLTATEKTRHTVGMRLAGELCPDVCYDVELPVQFGEEGSKDIWAYAFHADISKQWPEQALKPRVSVAYNMASGDDSSGDDENNTFLPLYGTAHVPFGLIDLFRWQNMREIELKTELFLNKKLTLIPQTNFFWLDNTNDYWYNSSGGKVRSSLPKGDVDSYVGQELSMVVKYKCNKSIKLEAGYAHFFSGGYIEDTGASDDADFCYTQFCYSF